MKTSNILLIIGAIAVFFTGFKLLQPQQGQLTQQPQPQQSQQSDWLNMLTGGIAGGAAQHYQSVAPYLENNDFWEDPSFWLGMAQSEGGKNLLEDTGITNLINLPGNLLGGFTGLLGL